MIPYARGLILDNSNNYGIVQTETVFGFVPPNHNNYMNNSFSDTEPMEWILTQGSFERPLFDSESISRSLKIVPKVIPRTPSESFNTKKTKTTPEIQKSNKKLSKKHIMKTNRQSKGVKKCIFKILNKKNKRKKGGKIFKKGKKYMMPIILGLLAAKSLLIPIILKFLAFISAKGLAMGFFSTVLASVLSLKNVFDHNHYQSRKDDSKTQVEIVQVPGRDDHHYYRNDDHDYYYDDYKRGDHTPVVKWPVKYNLGVLGPQNNRIS